MEFVRIPGDCFIMGSPDDEEGHTDDEGPQHEVCLDAFWMGKFEVTNAQYRQFKSDHDSGEYEGHALNDDAQPAVLVSWEEATAFAEWLTAEHKGQYTFRLPSEAEWEYAARAGTETSRYWGDDVDLNKACQYANVWDETAAKAFNVDAEFACDDTYSVTAPVGQFLPNVFGVYDMLGNVWEWCADWYSGDIYQERKQQEPVWNPVYTDDGRNRVLRGGSWFNVARYVRSAIRDYGGPAFRNYDVGFRLVRIE
jgi:formylglycine-generating enzyme required for sulfatase activity